VDRLFVDTNIFLGYMINDDPAKADRVENILRKTIDGELRLMTSLMVITEIIWTLESYYGLSKEDIREKVSLLLNTPNLDVPEKQRTLRALAHYGELNVDFIDAYNAHFARDHRLSTILTYNKKHFDRIDWLKRREP
jgi:predicted nucleic acid-binding protein